MQLKLIANDDTRFKPLDGQALRVIQDRERDMHELCRQLDDVWPLAKMAYVIHCGTRRRYGKRPCITELYCACALLGWWDHCRIINPDYNPATISSKWQQYAKLLGRIRSGKGISGKSRNY
jgi:hypothetical protein